MSIPRLNIPTYKKTLPSGKEITYRPFTVKERTILLLALQEGNPEGIYNAIGDLFKTCTNGLCKIDDMPIVDSEYLFICIRNKSVGEELELIHTCDCKKENNFSVNLDNLEVVGEKPSNDIDLGGGNWLKLKLPTLKNSSVLSEDPSEDEIISVIASCIDTIIVGSAVFKATDSTQAELIDFVENLTQHQIMEVEKFFSAIPKVVVRGNYKCSCGNENLVVLEGLHNFFV